MESECSTGRLLAPYSRPKSVQLVPVIFEKDEEPPALRERGVSEPSLLGGEANDRQTFPSAVGEKCYACIVSREEKLELASALEVV